MLKGLFFTTEDIKKDKKLKKTLWPLFIDGIQLPQGYNHFEEAVYFLPFSSPEIFGTHFIHLGTMKGWVDLGTTQ